MSCRFAAFDGAGERKGKKGKEEMKKKSFVTALAVSAMILGMGASVAAAIE